MSRWPGNASNEKTTFGGLSRSELMSKIRSSGNASTELAMVKLLRSSGLKGWRRNYKLVGKPDFVWPREKLILFVDGCFWHGHDCKRNLVPKRNAKAWADKISNNQSRDRKVTRELKNMGWKVVRVWECSLIKDPNIVIRRIVKLISNSL